MLLNEIVNSQRLYHTTTMNGALAALKAGHIAPLTREKSTGKYALCLSRSKQLIYNEGSVRYVINREMLANHFKIAPVDAIHKETSPKVQQDLLQGMIAGEWKIQEERVYKPIPVDSDYIVCIEIIENNIEPQEASDLRGVFEYARKLKIPLKFV